VTGVAFGTTAAARFRFVSDTIDRLGPASVGPSPIVTADNYVYEGAPTITSVTPGKGPLGGGSAVTIVGTNFTAATAVTFGAGAATSVVVVSSTKITVKLRLTRPGWWTFG
jgi:hypothetical protein